MQDRSPSTFPLTNFILFVVLSFAILVGYSILMGRMRPPPAEKGEKSEKADKSEKGENGVKEQPAVIKPAVEAEPAPKEKPAAEPAPARPVAARPVVPPQWVTLGSIDPEDPYRMLVTLSNRGAALARIELSSDRYHDLEDRSGYLGHLVLEDGGGTKGCPVQVVGAGTPAAKAGLKPGDFITGVNDQAVGSAMDLEKALADTQPGKSVKLAVRRDGRPMELSATLIRRPLEIVRPETRKPEVFLTGKRVFDSVQVEDNVPLGMLATLQQIDGEKIPPDADPDNIEVARELKGLDLRTVAWEVVEPDREHVVFRCKLPGRGLEVTKTYRLAKVPEDALGEADADAYHLDFDFSIKNVDGKAHDVAYRLDGPNSLPHEGAWYATKVSRNWGGGGLRDVVYKLAHDSASQIGSIDLADEKSSSHKMAETSADKPFQFLAVEAQYFSAALMPDEKAAAAVDRAMAMRVGDVDPQRKNITNTSFRIVTKAETLAAGKELSHHYRLFAGPKRPDLLKPYGLGDLIYYGWPIFHVVAEPMTKMLEFFYHYLVFNYGLAIIMLTVLVRLALFPLGRKQAKSAQVMQKLQPEIKKLQEKYKKDLMGLRTAQQKLFREHNYNPLGGCLVAFIQIPVFMGLYRSLQVDVELRDASLLGHGVRWCSNLAGPEMLYDWSWFMPAWVNSGIGMFGLGPYFNILPLVTVALMIVQQKMFMPPPADEQAAMQQKVMNFMMIFMGVLFYKVAAGLCIYFIVSSLWGLGERKFLPKTAAKSADDEPPADRVRRPPDGGRNGDRRKKRGRK